MTTLRCQSGKGEKDVGSKWKQKEGLMIVERGSYSKDIIAQVAAMWKFDHNSTCLYG